MADVIDLNNADTALSRIHRAMSDAWMNTEYIDWPKHFILPGQDCCQCAECRAYRTWQQDKDTDLGRVLRER